MKKTIIGPGGEKFEIEGTPEEISSYEELVKNEGLKQQPKKGKKRVLNEHLDMASCDCFSCGLLKAGWTLKPPVQLVFPDPFPFFPYIPPNIIVSPDPCIQPLIGPYVPSDGTGMPPYPKIWC